MQYAGSGVVTRQGQITVPKKIRKATGIDIGSVLEFYYNDEMIIVKQKKAPSEAFEQLAERISEKFKVNGITREDVVNAVREVRKEMKEEGEEENESCS